MTNLISEGTRLISWCKKYALPLWANNGLDRKGGFYEALKINGEPVLNSLRRVRVQARQCYVYAHAGHLEWFDNAHKISNHGWEYLTANGFQGGNEINNGDFAGCAHLLNSDGSLNDGSRDTYAQAFLLLASSWRYRAFNDPQSLECLEKTTEFLNTFLKADNEGWVEGTPKDLPRRQNPHMHLFEAFLAAYEATSDLKYMNLADDIFSIFKNKFFDESTHALLEFFDQNWLPDTKKGDLVEPGHMMEWCWLIHLYERLSIKNVSDYAEKLYQAGIKLGTSYITGLIINEVHIKGRKTNTSSRLWPQTEYIKANIARAEKGFNDAEDAAAEMIDKLFSYFLDVPTIGGWHDERDFSNNLISNSMPASTFYHIMSAAAEVHRYINEKT
jgi:mannose-6-phosphate isomerase